LIEIPSIPDNKKKQEPEGKPQKFLPPILQKGDDSQIVIQPADRRPNYR
jgi:hypothetical protein